MHKKGDSGMERGKCVEKSRLMIGFLALFLSSASAEAFMGCKSFKFKLINETPYHVNVYCKSIKGSEEPLKDIYMHTTGTNPNSSWSKDTSIWRVICGPEVVECSYKYPGSENKNEYQVADIPNPVKKDFSSKYPYRDRPIVINEKAYLPDDFTGTLILQIRMIGGAPAASLKVQR